MPFATSVMLLTIQVSHRTKTLYYSSPRNTLKSSAQAMVNLRMSKTLLLMDLESLASSCQRTSSLESLIVHVASSNQSPAEMVLSLMSTSLLLRMPWVPLPNLLTNILMEQMLLKRT